MENQLNPTHKQIADFLTDKIISDMTQFLMDDYGYSMEKALDMIYTSHLMTILQDYESELYVQSPSYNYELLIKELKLYPVYDESAPTKVAENNKQA